MTKLEKMLAAECHDAHEGDPAFEEFEYDPRDGHFHVDPWPPEFLMGEYTLNTFSNDPPRFHMGEEEWSIENLKELRDWLNIVLVAEEIL